MQRENVYPHYGGCTLWNPPYNSLPLKPPKELIVPKCTIFQAKLGPEGPECCFTYAQDARSCAADLHRGGERGTAFSAFSLSRAKKSQCRGMHSYMCLLEGARVDFLEFPCPKMLPTASRKSSNGCQMALFLKPKSKPKQSSRGKRFKRWNTIKRVSFP